jgi:hypothetical protein
MRIQSLFCIFLLLLNAFAKVGNAQGLTMPDASQRAERILLGLPLTDIAKRSTVESILTSHFDSLNRIFTVRKTEMQAAVSQSSGNKELADARSKTAWDAATGKLNKLHATFLGKLSSLLTAAQIEKLKDSMTEGLLQKEYNRFLQLLPDLTEQQKAQVMSYLREARENAMDAETADMRRQWFIKYRGRANNFLAAAGFDLRRATDELEQRKSAGKKEQTLK